MVVTNHNGQDTNGGTLKVDTSPNVNKGDHFPFHAASNQSLSILTITSIVVGTVQDPNQKKVKSGFATFSM